MSTTHVNTGVSDANAPRQTGSSPARQERGPRFGRLGAWAAQGAAAAIAAGFLAALVTVGMKTGWSVPKFSTFIGGAATGKDDWCDEHSVPDSICVECRKECATKTESKWCRTHGVHECPLCRPEVAQTDSTPVVTSADRERAAKALAHSLRTENNSKCKLHERRIQVTNDDVITRLGIRVEQVGRAAVKETIAAPAEVVFDKTRVARLAARTAGTVWWVGAQVGERVRRGDVLALVDSADVGRAKSEFQQALVQHGLRIQAAASLRASSGAIAGKSLQDAEAAVLESEVRLLTAEQALANLGLSIRADDVRGLTPPDLARRLQFLGIPETLVAKIAGRTNSSNLIAVTATFEGEVVERAAAAGEAAEPSKPLFVVADPRHMWLMLRVGLEDAGRVKPGQAVKFQHGGHPGWDDGTVAWVGPAADERTRTVPVRVDFPNPSGVHHANTFGTAHVVLRVEPDAIVVPSSAVHWEGDCNVVFVRDRNFDRPGSPKVFHVRSVRPGAQDVAAKGAVTEVVAGLAPGEWVATANSGVFRTELLKNNLGAG